MDSYSLTSSKQKKQAFLSVTCSNQIFQFYYTGLPTAALGDTCRVSPAGSNPPWAVVFYSNLAKASQE